MKCYGYRCGAEEEGDLLELAEVSFGVSSSEDAARLRAVARFLLQSADLLELYGDSFDHEHLSYAVPNWPAAFPDVIVARLR